MFQTNRTVRSSLKVNDNDLAKGFFYSLIAWLDVDKTLFKHAITPSAFADFQEGRDDKIYTIRQ
jgi:hypothetical protein